MKLKPYINIMHRNTLRMCGRRELVKLLEKETEESPLTLTLTKILTQKAQARKVKINNWDYIKVPTSPT